MSLSEGQIQPAGGELKRHWFMIPAILILLAIVCALNASCSRGGNGSDGRNADDDTDDDVEDTEPPVINHAPIADGQEAGTTITVGADVSDPSGVAEVRLFYRYQRDEGWSEVGMTGVKGWYSAKIPPDAVGPPGVDYYIQATDASDNANTALAPPTAPAYPYSFSVVCTGTADIREVHNGVPLVPLPMPRIGDKIAVQFQVESGTFTVYQVAQHFIKWFGTVCSDSYSAHIYSDADDTPGYALASSNPETVTEGLNCPTIDYHTFSLNEPITFYEGEKFWAVIQAEDGFANLDALLDNGQGHDESDRCWGYTLGAWFSLGSNIAFTRIKGCQWP